MSAASLMRQRYKVGVDFDNTIARYDELIQDEAEKRGLVGQDCGKSKREIRDSIRKLPGGDVEWQKIQAVVYGQRMREAKLYEGVATFFTLCRSNAVRPFIVSHKTKTARYDATTNLRAVALSWMSAQGFFSPSGMSIAREDVYFEDTREKKVNRIASLGCSCFIDDLEEVFLERAFPRGVKKVLFSPGNQRSDASQADVILSEWDQITEYVFARDAA